MNLTSEQEASLQEYLVGQLEPICAADPKVLTMYILALLKREDMARDDVREFCATELQDFLKEETKPFIGRLFDVLDEMTSSGGGSHTREEQQIHHERRRDDLSFYEEDDSRGDTRSVIDEDRKRERIRSRSPSPTSYRGEEADNEDQRSRREERDDRDRKRRRGEAEEHGDEERDYGSSRGRDRHRDRGDYYRSSTSRRHERDIDRPLSSSRGRDEIPSRGGSWTEDRGPSQPSSVAVVSSGGSRHAGRESGRDGWGSRSRGGRESRLAGRKRGVCFDFEERGVCVRGESCEYEHLGQPLVVDEEGLTKLQSIPDEANEASAYNPEDPFLSRTGPIPVWHGSGSSQRGPSMNRSGRGAGLLSTPPTAPMHSRSHGVLPLPTGPYGDGLIPTPSAQQTFYEAGRGRGMRGWNGGRGSYQQRRHFEGEPGFGISHEIPSSDAVALGSTQKYHDGHGGGRGYHRHKRGRFEGGDFRGGRPPKPQTDSICVARIPPELNTIDKLNEHFKKFGSIVNIQLDPANKQAFVQFTSHFEALLALRSPEAVMGNRFIQVYLKKDEHQQQQQPSTRPSSAPLQTLPQLPPKPVPTPAASLSPRPAPPSTSAPAPASPAQSRHADTLKKKQQELLSKQIEQQKKLLTLLEKMQGANSKEKEEVKAQLTALTAKIGESMKKMRQDVTQQQKSVSATTSSPVSSKITAGNKLSADSETERLNRELAPRQKKNDEAANVAQISKEVESKKAAEAAETGHAEEGSPTSTTTSTSPPDEETSKQARVEALQKTLANLQEEAAKLGIPTSQIAVGPRGRGLRARAAPWWARGRGGRGVRGVRGVRGGRGRGYASRAFKLDNRTTVICARDVPEELRDEAALRAHFQTFGTVVSLARQPNSNNFLVQFAERYMAETAVQKGKNPPNHVLNLSWHETAQQAEQEETPEAVEGTENQPEEVEEYQGGDGFDGEFGLDEEVDADEEDKDEERSWKRE